MQSCQHPTRSIKKQNRAIAIIGYHVDISIATANVCLKRHHEEEENSLAERKAENSSNLSGTIVSSSHYPIASQTTRQISSRPKTLRRSKGRKSMILSSSYASSSWQRLSSSRSFFPHGPPFDRENNHLPREHDTSQAHRDGEDGHRVQPVRLNRPHYVGCAVHEQNAA